MKRRSQMIKVWLISLLFLFFFCQLATASENRFKQAATAYAIGDYSLASQIFASMTVEGISASLLYNLANSYAKSGKTGLAILNYERALRLAPGDSDISGNLELVRKEKGIFQEERTLGQRFVVLLGLNQWTILATGTFMLFATLLLLPSSRHIKKNVRSIGVSVCIFLCFGAITGMYGRYAHFHDGVVVVSDARIRISPFESAASIGTIREGRLFTPLKTHNDYVRIVDETGRTGWLAASAFTSIASF